MSSRVCGNGREITRHFISGLVDRRHFVCARVVARLTFGHSPRLKPDRPPRKIICNFTSNVITTIFRFFFFRVDGRLASGEPVSDELPSDKAGEIIGGTPPRAWAIVVTCFIRNEQNKIDWIFALSKHDEPRAREAGSRQKREINLIEENYLQATLSRAVHLIRSERWGQRDWFRIRSCCESTWNFPHPQAHSFTLSSPPISNIPQEEKERKTQSEEKAAAGRTQIDIHIKTF